MIKIGETPSDAKEIFFFCDECPICVGWEHRLRIAIEGSYRPQFEYCSCDKLQYPFYMAGYCEDAFETRRIPDRHMKHEKGRGDRRDVTRKKKKRQIEMAKECRLGWGRAMSRREDEVPTHVTRSRPSNRKIFFKQHSNRVVRRNKMQLEGTKGSYRKIFDLWWTID